MGGSKQQTKPSPENRFATGATLGYLLGPVDLGDSKASEAAALFSGPGQGLGILPDFQDLQALSGQSFFEGFGQNPDTGAFTNPNPVFQSALNTAFTTPEINIPSLGGFGGGASGFGGGGFGGQIIPDQATQDALSFLQNPDSVFDTLSGGPIVDEIRSLDEQSTLALRERAMQNLDEALEISLANDAAQGFISGSTIQLNRERITEGVLTDLNVILAEKSLQNTRFLGELAMQDIINRTNAAESIIQAALTEKGIDADFAARMAKIASDQATALAVASINSQTQLALNQQDNALQLLGLGQQDFQSSLDRQLAVNTLPFNTLAGLGGGGSISNASTKSI